MGKSMFSGTGVAMVTPFTGNGSVDFAAMARIVEHIISGGADYILALGTTSESPTLTVDERKAAAMFIRERNAGRLPLVIGLGGNCTRDAVETIRTWDLKGYDAILSVCPYYNKPNQEGLYRHFRAISEASPLPVILYNIPGRTGVNLAPETLQRIVRDCPNTIGIKEASGNLAQMKRIRELLPEKFALISGDDAITVDVMRLGGVGVISVLAQLYPAGMSDIVRTAAEGRFDEADAMFAPLRKITAELFEEGNPVGIKTALSVKGMCGATVRLPLAEGSEALRAKISESIAEYEKRRN